MPTYTVTVTANRSVRVNGRVYKKDDVFTLTEGQVDKGLPTLVTLGYVSVSPALPTGAAMDALLASSADADPAFPYEAHTNAPSIDQDIADGAYYDYVHGLKSLHVSVAGSYDRISAGVSVEMLIAPFGKTGTMDVKTFKIDENTIRIKNDTGGGVHIRARLQAYLIG